MMKLFVIRADKSIFSENMREALTAVNHGIEECIEVDREQYLWTYKRFRNRPEGEKSFYMR
jgi:KDO2-lipid IV(A) lauroyltransferase